MLLWFRKRGSSALYILRDRKYSYNWHCIKLFPRIKSMFAYLVSPWKDLQRILILRYCSPLLCARTKGARTGWRWVILLSFQLVENCGLSVCWLLLASVFVGADMLCFWSQSLSSRAKKSEEVEQQWSSHLQNEAAHINLIWAKLINCQEQYYTFPLHALQFTHMQCILSLAICLCRRWASVSWLILT